MGFISDDGILEAKLGPIIIKYSLNITQIDPILVILNNIVTVPKSEELSCYHAYS